MAVGLAPQVLVNGIAPGYPEGTRATSNRDLTFQEQAKQGALLKRAADKDDIADQVVALCRTDSITGQTLMIDSSRFFHEPHYTTGALHVALFYVLVDRSTGASDGR